MGSFLVYVPRVWSAPFAVWVGALPPPVSWRLRGRSPPFSKRYLLTCLNRWRWVDGPDSLRGCGMGVGISEEARSRDGRPLRVKEALPTTTACAPDQHGADLGSRGSGVPSLSKAHPRAADEGSQALDSPCAFLCLRVTWTLDFAILRRGPRGVFDARSPPPARPRGRWVCGLAKKLGVAGNAAVL